MRAKRVIICTFAVVVAIGEVFVTNAIAFVNFMSPLIDRSIISHILCRVALLVTNSVAPIPVLTGPADAAEAVGPTLAANHPVAVTIFPSTPTAYCFTVLLEHFYVAFGRAGGAWSYGRVWHRYDGTLDDTIAIVVVVIVSRDVAHRITFAVANPLRWADVEGARNGIVISLVVILWPCHCNFPAVSVVEVVARIVA